MYVCVCAVFLLRKGSSYAGFNLLAFDLCPQQAVYLTNRPDTKQVWRPRPQSSLLMLTMILCVCVCLCLFALFDAARASNALCWSEEFIASPM